MTSSRGKHNQNHGTIIETMIRHSFNAPIIHIDDIFDIAAEFNGVTGHPISVKATCTDVVYLADARRWWDNQKPLQVDVGRYASVGTKKVWFETRTFLLGSEALSFLRGNVPYVEVVAFHNDIHSFGPGEHAAARVLAKSRRVWLEETYGKSPVRLNAKIDSKQQRRLQCSVRLAHLAPFLISTETVNYRGIKLPVVIDMEGDVEKQAA